MLQDFLPRDLEMIDLMAEALFGESEARQPSSAAAAAVA